MAGELLAQRRQRILMTADAVGGVWQYATDLIAVLPQFDFLVATMGPRPSPAQKQQLGTLANATLAESDFALEWMPGAERDVEPSSTWLLRLQEDFQPDLVHLNGYSQAGLPWSVPSLVVGHSCVFSWWRAVHKSSPDASWSWYKRVVTQGLHAASAVIAPSRAMASALEHEYGFSAEAIQVISNASVVPQAPRSAKLPFCFAAGRLWDEGKNLKLLQSIRSAVNWPIRIAGEHSGHLPHTKVLEGMREAAIFAHPALYEPFGLAVLEAARSRCCLVLADIPSLRELWDGCARFVDPRDPDRWVQELNSLIENAEKRDELAGRACAHAQQYQILEFGAAYEHLYRSQMQVPAGAAA